MSVQSIHTNDLVWLNNGKAGVLLFKRDVVQSSPTSTRILAIPLTVAALYRIMLTVQGLNSVDGQAAIYRYNYSYRRNSGGSFFLVDDQVGTIIGSVNDPGTTAVFGINPGGNSSIVIDSTIPSSTTWNWGITVEVTRTTA